MQYEAFKTRVLDNLTSYKKNILLCQDDGTYKGVKYSHILPENRRLLNLLPTVKNPGRGFRELVYAHHLNSSQMMCYNFFKPLLEENEGRKILIEIIRKATGISIESRAEIANDEIGTEYIFESPGRDHFGKVDNEGTKFDFYLRLSTGEKLYWEIKYTEPGFSKLNLSKGIPESYERKWNYVYTEHLKYSMILNDMGKEEFYSNYQLNRLVSYIRNVKDYVILLFCFDNEAVKKEAEKMVNFVREKGYNNLIMLDWNDICKIAEEECDNTRFYRHYGEFKEKYLDY